MERMIVRWTVAVVLASASVVSAVCAQESEKTLPTLLIKGEVVSVDTNDPAASLLKVKDRYGFETPIYLTPETKITQGDQVFTVADLTQGAALEVEYNFDINTAKRHAVSVRVSGAPEAASPAASQVTTPSSPAPMDASAAAPAVAAPAGTPEAASSAPAPEAPATASTATQEHPGKEHPGEATP